MAEISKINIDGTVVDLKDARARQPADVNYLGMVQSGGDVTIQEGIITINDDSHNHKVENISDLTATASEINVLDGTTINTTELNTLKGIDTQKTVQTHLNDTLASAKQYTDTAESNAKTYADNAIAKLVGTAPSTLDTVYELAEAIEEHADVMDALNEAIGTKANASDLTAHANASDMHVTSTAKASWNAAATNSHTHSNKAVLDATTASYTTALNTKLGGIAAGAEVNQNAFSNVVVGSTTIAADAKTDTLTLAAGSNVTITPDATNDKITIAATDTTYSAATQSAQGLMSAADKIKLDGVATGATKVLVDSGLSSTSTNPVQNKIITAALTGKANKLESTASTAAAAGWYRIATTVSSQENAVGIFKIVGAVSGYHTTAIITAGISYGTSPNIQVLQCSNFSNAAITKARIVYHSTYQNNYAYLEVYKAATSATSIAVSLIERNSWSLVAPSTAGSVPSGYSSKEISLTANAISAETFVGALSGNASSATTATQLGTNAGSATQPVYFSGGKPVATTYTLGASVPSGAKFTDTTYSAATTSVAGLMSAADKTKLDGITAGANKYTHPAYTARTSGLYKITVDATGHVSAVTAVAKADITALGIPAQDTVYTHPNSGVAAGTYQSVTVNAAGHVTAASANVTVPVNPAAATITAMPVGSLYLTT